MSTIQAVVIDPQVPERRSRQRPDRVLLSWRAAGLSVENGVLVLP